MKRRNDAGTQHTVRPSAPCAAGPVLAPSPLQTTASLKSFQRAQSPQDNDGHHQSDHLASTDLLVARRPAYLVAYPPLAGALARQCIKRGIELPQLREVAAYGEPVEDATRTDCLAAWNIPVHDRYSAEEVGYIALQCPEDPVVHVQSESVYLELLDCDGQPVPSGQAGRVVVTALHNFASPLLRYELGDWAIAGALCECGRGLPVLQRVLGRDRNCLHLPAPACTGLQAGCFGPMK